MQGDKARRARREAGRELCVGKVEREFLWACKWNRKGADASTQVEQRKSRSDRVGRGRRMSL